MPGRNKFWLIASGVGALFCLAAALAGPAASQHASGSGESSPAISASSSTQDNSVESFFQLKSSGLELSSGTDRPAGKSAGAGGKSAAESHKNHFLYHLLDNIGIPLPTSKIDGLDPDLKKPVLGLPANAESAGFERIQPPEQSSFEISPLQTINQKIPQSELEGTMYDSPTTTDANKTAP